MKLNIEVEDVFHQVHIQNIRGKTWMHLNGRSFSVESEEKKSGNKTSKTSGHAGDLIAPMPGKITKLLKHQGDSVKRGQAVLVMEAMKMEYTLKADGDGTIDKISCSVGDQVILGKILVHISPLS